MKFFATSIRHFAFYSSFLIVYFSLLTVIDLSRRNSHFMHIYFADTATFATFAQ